MQAVEVWRTCLVIFFAGSLTHHSHTLSRNGGMNYEMGPQYFCCHNTHCPPHHHVRSGCMGPTVVVSLCLPPALSLCISNSGQQLCVSPGELQAPFITSDFSGQNSPAALGRPCALSLIGTLMRVVYCSSLWWDLGCCWQGLIVQQACLVTSSHSPFTEPLINSSWKLLAFSLASLGFYMIHLKMYFDALRMSMIIRYINLFTLYSWKQLVSWERSLYWHWRIVRALVMPSPLLSLSPSSLWPC